MSTLGDQTFHIIRGLPASLKQRVDVWEVPGIDGYGAQTLGLGDARFGLTCIAYTASSGAANTLIGLVEAMQGTLQTLVDDWGDTYTSLLVEKVDTTGAKKSVVYNGNFNAVRVQLSVTCCSTVPL